MGGCIHGIDGQAVVLSGGNPSQHEKQEVGPSLLFIFKDRRPLTRSHLTEVRLALEEVEISSADISGHNFRI